MPTEAKVDNLVISPVFNTIHSVLTLLGIEYIDNLIAK